MSRIGELFNRKQQEILNVYFTAGFPRLEDTLPVMRALQQHGADMIELGMPYSDPLADGPVIQQSSSRALANGMTIPKLFEQLQDFRRDIGLPVVLMGYLNPVLQYGFERFCADAAAAGIDGLILPDLPVGEYERKWGAVIRQYGLDFSFLVTPETPPDRVRRLDELSSGFLYAVSSSSTTGGPQGPQLSEEYLRRLQSAGLKNPVLVGFGIRDAAGFRDACRYANGAIVGSAYIKALEINGDIDATTRQFLTSLRGF